MIDLIHSFFVWFVSHPEFPWIYFFLMLTASYIFSEVAEKRARAKHPGPFRWGYFMGCMGLACAPAALMSVAALVVVIAGSSPQNTITQMILQTAMYSFRVVCGWFIVAKRQKWAWGWGSAICFLGILPILSPIGLVGNFVIWGKAWEYSKKPVWA